MNLIIITPCSRPENLEKIKDSINLNCRWIIVYDADVFIPKFNEPWITELCIKGGVVGKMQINHALDQIDNLETWVYVLDDDNLLHPKFRLLKYMSGFFRSSGYIFGQDLGNGQKRIPVRESIKVCHVNQAQFLLKMDIIKSKRYIQKYEADGHFIEELFKSYPERISVIDDVLSFYNRLKWEK